MATITFDELVRQEQEAIQVSSAGEFNPFRERDAWLERLDELYGKVEEFLADYVKSGGVKIAYESIRIEEEQVGSYSAREMLIFVGRKTVRLEPIGTFLIGSKGRVDVVGPGGTGRLTLIGRHITDISQLVRVSVSLDGSLPSLPPRMSLSERGWVWKMMGRPPKLSIRELTKDSFLDLLAEVANG